MLDTIKKQINRLKYELSKIENVISDHRKPTNQESSRIEYFMSNIMKLAIDLQIFIKPSFIGEYRLEEKYNLKNIIKELDRLIREGNKTISLLQLFDSVGFYPLDIEVFYKKFIKGHIIYKNN